MTPGGVREQWPGIQEVVAALRRWWLGGVAGQEAGGSVQEVVAGWNCGSGDDRAGRQRRRATRVPGGTGPMVM
jgi:hypothetical protein